MTNSMHKARAALALHPRCGAHCRTTGEPCKNPAMKNGRCRMHGGKSTGRPITTGENTKTAKKARKKRAEARNLIRCMLSLIEDSEF